MPAHRKCKGKIAELVSARADGSVLDEYGCTDERLASVDVPDITGYGSLREASCILANDVHLVFRKLYFLFLFFIRGVIKLHGLAGGRGSTKKASRELCQYRTA